MKSKRFLSFLLVLCMVFSLAACTQKPAEEKPKEESKVAEEKPKEEKPKEEKPEEKTEDNYTSLDDFKLWDEDGNLTLTGRDAVGENGIVASGKYEASKIGTQIIEQGGNAVDAAVAVGFALGLVEPNACGPGGGGFMLVKSAETGDVIFMNFREKAPSQATPDMWQKYTDESGKEMVIGNQKEVGGKAVGVPGTVAGLLYALENYGTMTPEQVLKPVIELAKKGYTVTTSLSAHMGEEYADMMRFSECADLYLKDVDGMKVPYEPGDTFKNPNYAKLMEMIAKGGRDAFYKGDVAKAIVDNVTKYGGLMTMEDLANYEVELLEPVHTTYRGYDLYSSPSPSSGGTIVFEILNILENFDMKEYDFDSPERLHLFADAFSMAYADRGKYMGDVKFVKVPVKGLLSKDYAKKLAGKISSDKAMENVMPDDPWMFEHEDTTHYSVADKDGNMVATTFTINYFFGSKVAIPDYGIVMNNEMDDFVAEKDHPNSIAGGKTPLSSMSPTLVFKDGKPFAALGSPGGTTIMSTVSQIISNLIDYDMDMQEAVNAPRIKGFKETTITYENRFNEETIKKMEEMGHKCKQSDEWNRSFGSVNAVRYSNDGKLQGAGDPRRDGKALGF